MMTFRQNCKAAPFKVGQSVRHFAGADDSTVRTILWVSKGATCREDQLISTDRNDRMHPYSDASIYVEAA